jgi:hypothetical protein
MEVQRMRSRLRRPSRSILRAAAALTATVVLLAACGGDGGDGTTSGAVLHALIVNASAADVTVSYTGADAADVTQKTCSADIHNFPLADPFTIAVDGKTVLDSAADLPDGIPNQGESDLIVRIDIAEDGTASFDRVRPGSDIGKPSKAAYCPTLPG